jgi:hypothetical protein
MPSIYRFARILIAKPVPTFAEYAQEKPVSWAFGGRPPSLKRRIPRRHHRWRQFPPADNADLLKSYANSLFGQYFRLNDFPLARTQGPAFSDQPPHDFALRRRCAVGDCEPLRRRLAAARGVAAGLRAGQAGCAL